MTTSQETKKEPTFRLQYISIDLIDVSSLNVRTVNASVGIDELAESIKRVGLQQPIVVVQKGERYEVVIGQRRFLAAKKARLKKIPALIRTVGSDKEAIIASFSENIHRLDLDYRDKMRVAEILLSYFDSTQSVADQLGVTEQTVRNYLGYSIVPDKVKEMVDKDQLSATTAIRIARSVPDKEKAINIASKVKEIPRSEERKRLIDLARDNPDIEATELIKIAKKVEFSRITIDLTPRVAMALEKASTEYDADKVDLAKEAIIAWLIERGFFK